MKKIVFILYIFLFSSSFCFEDVPVFPLDSGFDIRYVENEKDEINFNGMKKADKIKKAQDINNSNKIPRFKFDERQINHQRALDFTTNQVNSTQLPRF